MKPINVLVVSSKYAPEYAGSGLRARNTYKRLAEKFPVTFEVLTSSVTHNNCETYDIDGRQVTRIAKKPFSLAADEVKKSGSSHMADKLKHGCNYICEAALAWKYLIRNGGRFDVIHIFGRNWVTAAAVTFAKITGKPLIVELCNESYTPHHYEPLPLRAVLGEKFPKGTSIVCISGVLKEMCERHGYKDGIWCRPNPVDDKIFFLDFENKMKFRRKYTSFSDADVLLVSIGKFRPTKNQIFLLDVIRKLPEKFKLILAGPLVESGPFAERDRAYLEGIKTKVVRYRLESRVKVEAKFIEKVDEYLKMSDVFVFPTTQEALGTPMLEAISCGLPVVANRIPGVTDCWIEDGKNGFISNLNTAEFADKVMKVAGIDPATLKMKREKIRSMCSSDLIDKKYFVLIKEAIKKKQYGKRAA